MYIRPGAASEIGDQVTDVEGSLTGFFKIDDQGELHIYDGPDSNEWLPTGAKFDLDERGNATNWIRLSFRQDFERGLWDIAIDGHIFRANLAMADRAESLEKIELVGQSRSPLYIDDIQVSRDAIAFSDADRDGLPDDWEAANDLNRNDDLDQDGLTNIEEFILGTKVNNADSDRDGQSDGDEYAAGTDPTVANDSPDTAATSVIGKNGLIYATAYPLGNGYSEITLTVGGQGGYFYFRANLINSENYPHMYSGTFQITNNDLMPTIPVFNAYVGTGSALLYLWVENPNSQTDSVILALGGASNAQSSISTVSFDDANGSTPDAMEDVAKEYCGLCPDDDWSELDGSCELAELFSVRLAFNLGKGPFGDRDYVAFVREEEWSDRVYSRSSLQFNPKGDIAHGRSPIEGPGSYYTAKRTEETGLSWVRTETAFTRFDDINHGYLVRQYSLDQVTNKNEPIGQPYKTVKVYNPDPSGSGEWERLLVETVHEGRRISQEFQFRTEGDKEFWRLLEGSTDDYVERPLRLKELVIDDPNKEANGDFTKTWTISHWNQRQGKMVVDSVVKETYRRYDFGVRKVERVVDPEGQALSVKLDYYGPEAGGFPITGRLKWAQDATGNWRYYVYDDQGRVTKAYGPDGNTPLATSEPASFQGYRVIQHEYDGADYQRKTTEHLKGGIVSTVYKQWDKVEAGKERRISTITAVDETVATDHPRNRLSSKTLFADSDKLKEYRQPNGRRIVKQYEPSDDGFTRIQIATTVLPNGVTLNVEERVLHRTGTLLSKKETDAISQIVTHHQEAPLDTLDSRMRPTVILNQVTGEMEMRSYACCGMEWKREEDGRAVRYEHDALGRRIRVRQGFKADGDFGNTLTSVTSDRAYLYDGLDRKRETHNGLNPTQLPTVSTYNLASQQIGRQSSAGVTTSTRTIMLEDGGRLELTSLPKSGHDNRHRITNREYAADGKLVNERHYAASEPFARIPDPRTQTRHLIYRSGRDDRGHYREAIDSANLFDQRITRTYQDHLGNRTNTIYAYGSRYQAIERFDYNDINQLIRHIDPDGVTTRYAYNEEGDRTTTAIDLDIQPGEAPNHIDYELDRISVVDQSVIQRDGQAIRRTENKVYTETGPVTTSINETTLTGERNWSWQYNQLSTTVREEGEAPGSWTITNTGPSGAYIVQSYENGRLKQTSRYANDDTLVSWIAQEYDASGRMWKSTDSRTGTTTYHYDDQGRRWKVSAPNPETRSSTDGTLDTINHFDALGQVTTTVKPSGGEVHRVYNANGTLHKTHGHHTTDVQWRYNGRGERTRMITWYTHLNKPAPTRWHYNVRGQLAFKQDAHGHRVHYTYTPGGKLETRTWARGVQTSYHYNDANNLTHIDYSDATPDVHFTYTRLGQKQTVQDAGGLLTYTYRSDQPTVLLSETRSGDFQSPPNPDHRSVGFSLRPLYNEPKTLTYTQDPLIRSTGFQIGTSENPSQDYAVTYGYDQANRLDRVSSQGYDFVYTFEPMSTADRLQSVTADGVKHTQYQYEPGRDTTTAVINQAAPNNQLISHYAYQYNQDGQRTERTTTTLNPETNILNPSYTDTFQYQEDTGGLTQSTRNANPNDPNTEYYGYDKIGNRTSMGKGNGEFALYDTNALNQYTSIWNQDGIQAVTHDLDGNQLTKGNQEYTWDAENRLTEVREHGALRAKYTYDYQSRRIAS